MTNKEFRDILALYPDDYEIQMDNSFGWEVPTNKNKVDPELYINTDFGFIEIEPPVIRDIWHYPPETPTESGYNYLVVTADKTLEICDFFKDETVFHYWNFYDDCQETLNITTDDIICWMEVPCYNDNNENDNENMATNKDVKALINEALKKNNDVFNIDNCPFNTPKDNIGEASKLYHEEITKQNPVKGMQDIEGAFRIGAEWAMGQALNFIANHVQSVGWLDNPFMSKITHVGGGEFANRMITFLKEGKDHKED